MPSTTRRGLLASFGVATVGGCLSVRTGDSGDLGTVEGEWPLVGQDAGHRRRAASGPVEPETVWERGFADARGTSSPSIADGRVYTTIDAVTDRARHRYQVHSLDAANGKPIWQVPLRAEPNGPPAVSGSHIVVSARRDLEGGRLVGFEERYGEEEWLYDIDARVTAAPVTVDGIVYIPDWSGTVHALSTSDGSIDWANAVDIDGENRAFGQPAAVVDGTLYLGSMSGRTGVVAVDAANGEPVWSRSTGPVTAGPVADEDLVVVQSHSLLSAFATDGSERWAYNIPDDEWAAALALDDRHVYVPRGETLYAIGRDGEHGWTFEGIASAGSPPTVAGNVVLVDGDEDLIALDRYTGEVQWQADSPGSGPVIATPEAMFMHGSGSTLVGMGK